MKPELNRAERNKIRQRLVDIGVVKAGQGIDPLKKWWMKDLTPEQRNLIGETAKDLLKSIAEQEWRNKNDI